MSGMHKSPYFGYSVEFAQHRQYAPGDDIRHLDWKIMAKTDKLYLKQYQKETNLDLVLLVDTSGSMGYTSSKKKDSDPWTKYDCASSVACALAYLALRQQDRVGMAVFADEVRSITKASNAHGHWKSLVDTLSKTELVEGAAEVTKGDVPEEDMAVWSRATDLGRLFDQVTAKLARRSLVVLISDLFDDPESYERGLARMKHRRHDVIVLQTLDHAELTFPFRSPSQFIGMEHEGRLNLDPAALRKAYLDALNDHLSKVENITRRFGFDYLLVDSSESLGPPLSHFLARRAAIVNRGRA